jgi:NADH dehydrogenase [ubiquinone] 1 alpha subcomplex assembly factor 7
MVCLLPHFGSIAMLKCNPVFAYGPISQHNFLMKMGLEPRLAALVRGARDEERREDLRRAGMKLVDIGPQGMGQKFQLMALTNDIEAPYPFG